MPEAPSTKRFDVFISHSSRNAVEARLILGGLEDRGVKCWIAPRDITPGQTWADAIMEGIMASKTMVILLSTESNLSQQVLNEILQAVHKGLIVIPVRLEDVLPTRAMEFFLGPRHWMDAFPPITAAHLDRLAAILDVSTFTEGVAEKADAPDIAPQCMKPEEVWIGRKVGNYSLVKYLGAGGMGQVFLARHSTLGQTVAVKVSYPVPSGHDYVERAILRSVRGLAAVNHAAIARVFDCGTAPTTGRGGEQVFYIAMEYIDGNTLADSVGKYGRSLPLSLGVEIFLSLCDGLDQAHRVRYVDVSGFEQTGILHGDIKPGNVMLTRKGEAKLIDFMLVDLHQLLASGPTPIPRSTDGLDQSFPKTTWFGTEGYMAPEQGCEGVVTVRTDVFGLGALLFEMFSGKRLFEKSVLLEESAQERPYLTRETMERELKRLNPAVPRQLAAVIFRATAPDAAERHQSVRELREDAANALKGKPWWRIF